MPEIKDLDQILIEEGYEDGQIKPSRRHEKQRSPQGKTSSIARQQAEKASRQQREEQARQTIRRDIGGLFRLSTEKLDRKSDHNPWDLYVKWLSQSLGQGEVILNESDFRFVMARSSGPGGQHAQKTETSVVVIHKPTKMRAKCEDSRLAEENRRSAHSVLMERLSSHLRLWKVLIKSDDQPNESQVRKILDKMSKPDYQ